MSSRMIWECNLCGKSGEGKSSEQQHQLSVHTEKECKCGQPMSYAHLSYHHIHIDHHCKICGVHIKSKMAMEVHVEGHKKEKK